jgi:hypothetical protein
MWAGSLACSCGLTHCDAAAQAYNEEAFRHFLALERKRSQRGQRSFLLLLVSLRKQPGTANHIPPAVASKLFAGLATCVREVDFLGWYRHERIAGAVLVQGGTAATPDASRGIGDRVTQALSRHVPSAVVERLQVRVLHSVGA